MKAISGPLALLMGVLLAGTAFAAGDGLASPENTAPVAENQELETYRGVSVGGRLSAYDAEGDALTYELATEPLKGTVAISADGCFVYTPDEGRRGRDYFSFRAVDARGSASQEGTVIIRLLKQKTKLTYADMSGSSAEYAAVALTEAGVFTGEALGSDYVFVPGGNVTRGEFLTMCMNAADCRLLSGVRTTGFLDDGEIAGWLKPYVATALMHGYIRGTAAETGAVFRPEAPITLRDACVMLNAVLGVTDVVSVGAYVDDSVTEGAQAVANLTASHVMLSRWEDLDAVLNRSQAAELLQNAMELLARRSEIPANRPMQRRRSETGAPPAFSFVSIKSLRPDSSRRSNSQNQRRRYQTPA